LSGDGSLTILAPFSATPCALQRGMASAGTTGRAGGGG
jgi:hypothetical protein